MTEETRPAETPEQGCCAPAATEASCCQQAPSRAGRSCCDPDPAPAQGCCSTAVSD